MDSENNNSLRDKDTALNEKLYELRDNGIYLNSLRQYDEAIECFDQALKIKSEDSYTLILKGISLSFLNRHDEAIKCFDQALNIKSNDNYSLICKGISLSFLGRYDEAIKCNSQAFNIEIQSDNSDENLNSNEETSCHQYISFNQDNSTKSSEFFFKPVDITSVTLSENKRTVVKVAAIQLDFKLSTKSFPFQIINKTELKAKVLKALEQASKRNVDIVCLPELCVCEEWLPLIQAVSKDMVVIAGSYYDAKRHNVCRLVIDSKVIDYSQMKINPSSLEKGTSYKSLMTSGDKLYIFKTKVGILSILICRDFLNYCHFLRDFVDIIFVPSYNREINFFQETAHVNVKASRTYVVISNTSVYGYFIVWDSS